MLRQPEGGSHNYYSEVARRASLIAEALEASGLAALDAPVDMGREPLAAAHSVELLSLIEHAYERMVHEVHGGGHQPRVVLPETFAVRHAGNHVPRSIWAHLGFFCYDTSSPIFEGTWQAVYWSAQAALNAANVVVKGESLAYALCRPPGHHASRDMFGGFCYLNNAAIAAQWLCGQGARVAVLDIDYHHGNGTQEIFYRRADVRTISIHVDPHVDYPYFWGHADEVGTGQGLGSNLNLPLARGAGEAEYLVALDQAVVNLRAFDPDILVLSLGVDTYQGDPVGGFLLDTPSFARIGARLAGLRKPIVAVQEGGYALAELGANVVSLLRGLVEA